MQARKDTFTNVIKEYDWKKISTDIYCKTPKDVEKALLNSENGRCTLEDFKALLSPHAQTYLEEMAQLSHRLTTKRFGFTMQLYAPMYLSNECQNICTYCGFSYNNKIPRKTLTEKELYVEAEELKNKSIKHILLVTGEANKTVGIPYISDAIEKLFPHFDNISIEVQPLLVNEYVKLINKGLHAVYVYQETYHPISYKTHHPKGKKSNYTYRLETPDRLGEAGINKIGLGALIGLEDWRVDSFFVALHLDYLEKKYWRTKYSISFPRLRPFSGGLEPLVDMSDKNLIQLICAYRLFNNEVELSLSTRESEHFRNHAYKLGITTMSAGSKTNPGGYSIYSNKEETSLEQFEISDERSPRAVADFLEREGYTPVWKDWDQSYALNDTLENISE